MPEREKEFEQQLSQVGDVLRIRFVRDGKPIIRFTVQYEAQIEDTTRRIVRYDTADGSPHRDLLDWDGSTRHSDPISVYGDYADAMRYAIRDLETNWERYRYEFLRRRP